MRVTFPERATHEAEWYEPTLLYGSVTLEVEPKKKRRKKRLRPKAPLGFQPPVSPKVRRA